MRGLIEISRCGFSLYPFFSSLSSSSSCKQTDHFHTIIPPANSPHSSITIIIGEGYHKLVGRRGKGFHTWVPIELSLRSSCRLIA